MILRRGSTLNFGVFVTKITGTKFFGSRDFMRYVYTRANSLKPRVFLRSNSKPSSAIHRGPPRAVVDQECRSIVASSGVGVPRALAVILFVFGLVLVRAKYEQRGLAA